MKGRQAIYTIIICLILSGSFIFGLDYLFGFLREDSRQYYLKTQQIYISADVSRNCRYTLRFSTDLSFKNSATVEFRFIRDAMPSYMSLTDDRRIYVKRDYTIKASSSDSLQIILCDTLPAAEPRDIKLSLYGTSLTETDGKRALREL